MTQDIEKLLARLEAEAAECERWDQPDRADLHRDAANAIRALSGQWKPFSEKPENGTIAVLFCSRPPSGYNISKAREESVTLEIALFEQDHWMEPHTGHSDYDEDWRPSPIAWIPLPKVPT